MRINRIVGRHLRRKKRTAREARAARTNTREFGLAHQSLHPLAADRQVFALEDGMDAGRAVDPAGVGLDLPDSLGQVGVLTLVRARFALGAVPAVVGGGGDVQFPQDALDSQVRALVEEPRHLGRVGSSCAAKRAEAVRRTSFARLSCAFSLRSAASSARSSVISRSSRSPAGEVVPSAAVRKTDRAACALVALVCPAVDAGLGEGVDDAVLTCGPDVMDGAGQRR